MEISSTFLLSLAALALAQAQTATLPLCNSTKADIRHSDYGQEGLCIGPQAHRQRRRAQTTSPIEPPEENDLTFVVNSAAGLDTACTFRAGGPLVFSVQIPRVFGDIVKLKDAGLISSTVKLSLPAYDVDFAQGEWDAVSVNGVRLADYLTGENNVWKLNTYYLPIEMLNFPTDPGVGGTVVPAENVISVEIDVNKAGWCVSFDWAAIEIEKAPLPVVLFHGILSDGDVWKSQWVSKLNSLGIPNDATLNLGDYDSIQTNSGLIATKITSSLVRWGVNKVDIVSHSKGGLDARHYAETADNVANVIQIAAPNGGSPLADFAQQASLAALTISNTVVINYFADVASVQLTTDYMAVYNSMHGLNENVVYTALAGEYDPDCVASDPSCRTLDRLLLAISGSPGDTIVPTWSVHNMDETSKLSFSSVGTDESAKHYPLIQSQAVYDQLQNSVTMGLGSSLSAPEPDFQITLSLAGKVLQDATFDASLDLDGTTEAYVVLLYPSGTLGFTLVSPDGTTIDTTYATNNPSLIGYEGSDFFEGKIAVYHLVNPTVGTWSVQVTGDQVIEEPGTVFVVNAFLFQPDIKLVASLATPSVQANTPLVYLAKPTDSGSPILSATAKATVALPDGTLTVVTLLDDGIAPDSTANDGVYTGSLTNTSQSGNYRAAVAVEGTGSPSFTREAFVLGSVTVATMTSSNFGETPRDTDGDVLYNFLDISFDVTSTVPGNFLLQAVLSDSADNEHSVVKTVSISGPTRVTVSFVGEPIYDNGVNGPYMLSSIRLAEESGYALTVISNIEDIYTTTAYSYTQFQRNALRLIGGTTIPIDNNSNALYDLLNVSLDVEADKAGAYTWSATVRDIHGTELGFSFGSSTFTVGSNVIVLSFQGLKIGNNFVDGPYLVSDFILYGAGESLVQSTAAYTTDALLWSQFEHTGTPPTSNPTANPTASPTTQSPTKNPTPNPTMNPTPNPTNSPTKNPTRNPTMNPTLNPTMNPTPNPTNSPTNNPTANPTNSPTKNPTANPTTNPTPNPTNSPTNTPTANPTNSPTKKPTQNPTMNPTAHPTNSPTKNPTSVPTQKPTEQPSKSPSSMPSDVPSYSPTSMPSSQPSIVTQTIRTPGTVSTNKEFCSFSDAEREAFTAAALGSIVEFACPGSNTCSASLTSACGQNQGARRELLSSSRQLQAQSNWQVEYVVVDTFTCERATCSSPSDISRVNDIVKTITDNMNESMSSGAFKETFAFKIIQSAALNANLVECLMVWGTVGAAETDVGGAGTGKTGVFYPDWDYNSGTCLQDGNEPAYMKTSTSWLSSSLEECCSHFYPGWNFNKCMNPSGSGLWYVSHDNGKCVTDCDEGSGGTCGGFANLVSNNLYSNPRSCCEAELFYRYIEFCEADSFLSECYEGTGLFYRGDNGGKEVCARDCDPASGDTTCGGIVEDAYIVLYETAEACCSSEYNWIDVELCAARTTQTSFGKYWPDKDNAKCLKDFEMPSSQLDVQIFDSLEDCCASGIFWLSKGACFAASGIAPEETGTRKFYVDWISEYCVQDCVGPAPCGGLAQAWDSLYDSSSECCARLPGRTIDDGCIYTA